MLTVNDCHFSGFLVEDKRVWCYLKLSTNDGRYDAVWLVPLNVVDTQYFDGGDTEDAVWRWRRKKLRRT